MQVPVRLRRVPPLLHQHVSLPNDWQLHHVVVSRGHETPPPATSPALSRDAGGRQRGVDADRLLDVLCLRVRSRAGQLPDHRCKNKFFTF